MCRHTTVALESQGLRLVGDRFEVPDRAEVKGTIVLLHGGGQTRHSWRDSAHAFAEQGWTSLALDARGHGDSDWASGGDYSIDALASDLRVVVQGLDEPLVLVGASMGGNTALVAQGEHPELAHALVLVDIAPRVEPEGVRRIMDFMSANPDGFASLQDVSDAVHAYNPKRERPANLEGLKKNVRQAPNGRWYWHWDPAFLQRGDEQTRIARYERLATAARSVTVPTLLVRGKNSDVLSNAGVAELLDLIPAATAIEADAGHMVAGDDNTVFTHQIMEFLDTN